MPGMNRTGPLGEGPQTGRGRGYCGGGAVPGVGRGSSRGCGRGRRRGHAHQPPEEYDGLEPRETLEQQKKELERSLKSVTSRLRALERPKLEDTE